MCPNLSACQDVGSVLRKQNLLCVHFLRFRLKLMINTIITVHNTVPRKPLELKFRYVTDLWPTMHVENQMTITTVCDI